MELKSLVQVSKDLGFKTVKGFLSEIDENYETACRMLTRYPRRIELVVKGLLYEKIQTGESVVVKAEEMIELFTELDSLKEAVGGILASRTMEG